MKTNSETILWHAKITWNSDLRVAPVHLCILRGRFRTTATALRSGRDHVAAFLSRPAPDNWGRIIPCGGPVCPGECWAATLVCTHGVPATLPSHLWQPKASVSPDTGSGKLPPVANYCHMAHETQNIYYLALCGKTLPVPEQNSLVAHMMDSHGRERDVSCPDIPSQTAAEQRLQEWFSYLYVISEFFLRYDPASRVGGFLAFREYKSVHFL